MNSNALAKPAKKLTLKKEIIHQLATTQVTNPGFGVTLNCSQGC